MGFFSFEFDHAKGRIQVSDQGWIWFAFTLPLTALTLGLSYFWIRLKVPNRRNRISPADDNLETSRKSEKPISKRSSVSSIATEGTEKFAELLVFLEQAKKGRSTVLEPLPSVPTQIPIPG